MKTITAATVLCVMLTVPTWAQKTYTVPFTTQPVTIDGVANEAAWGLASTGGGDFVGHDTGIPGTPSTQQTTFKALWDANNLYIYVQTQDTSPVFDTNLTTDNQTLTFSKDDFELFLDPISSRNSEPNPTHKYQLVVYPATNASGQMSSPPAAFKWVAAGDTDFPFPPNSWSSGLAVQVAMVPVASPAGYAAEIAIPWTAFDVALVNTQPVNLPPLNGEVWSVQVCRAHDSGNNTAASKWNPTASAGFRTKPWGLWTFTGRPAPTAAMDWSLFE
jgi:hypothetical protein